MAAQVPPPPNAQVLSLVSALSQTENHDLHVQAILAKDEALSSSPVSYGNLCVQLALLMVGCNNPEQMLQNIDRPALDGWRQANQSTSLRLEVEPMLWIPFGQMAGLILKEALLRPPIQPSGRCLSLNNEDASRLKGTLTYGLSFGRPELYNVVSSIIATTSVSSDAVQPFMHVSQWPELMPTLLQNIHTALNGSNMSSLNGSLSTIRKMIEDGSADIPLVALDSIVPLLLRLFQSTEESVKVAALQSLAACLGSGVVPSSLVMNFSDYFTGLSRLASDESVKVKKWVCRSINTILELHTHYLQPHMTSICQFMLQATVLQPSQTDDNIVAIEASEFWLLFATLDETRTTSDMMNIVENLLPSLIPTLLNNMVYSEEQRLEILAQNEIDLEMKESMKPIFHNSKQKHDAQSNVDPEDESDGRDWDEDDNEWNLRKYSGASLDSLSNLYGAGPILPALLPALQHGLSSGDAWIQEASILALGAIAEGCHEEMNTHMGELFPYLLNLLSSRESPTSLPQLKSICAWTIGRYAAWAVDQVQAGAQGHLLAQITEVLLQRLEDKNRKVQVACGSALGVVIETSGDLLLPYLEHICPPLVSAMSRYQGRSLIVVFDTLGIMADSCGPAIGENGMPALYVPTMLRMLNTMLLNDPTDQTILPMMESLATIALACGMNFQPYALETFENAMCVIEQIQLAHATLFEVNEEEADPIVCATDLIDGLCEGLGNNFVPLVASSKRYGQHFMSVVHSLCRHQAVGVRISALALVGDIARNAPSLLETGLSELLREAISNIEPTRNEMHSSLANNAVWAIGEICVQCGSNPAPFEPFASVLMQQLIILLMGNGDGRVSTTPGLAENAAACVGRLSVLNPGFVAPELPRFLLGWCEGISKVLDPVERRDAFTGFCKALYANPPAIQQCGVNVADVISSIIFAIISWHVPPEAGQFDFLTGDYGFQPFPPSEAKIGLQLDKLLKDIRATVGSDVWGSTQAQLPVNVLRLLHEVYDL